MNKPTLLLFTCLLMFLNLESQEYQEMINLEQYTVQDIQNAAQAYFKNKDKGRGTGYKSFKRWEYNALRMQDNSGFLKSPSFYYNELERYNSFKNKSIQLGRATTVSSWEQLGPTDWNQTSGWNPGVGRITSIAIDPSDVNHIIVGSPTGGVWKSLDGGATWSPLTDNLSNIVVYALTIDPLDSNTYYWGSSFGVIFKSIDAGSTWNEFADTGNGTVNKILINPTNTNQLFCSSRGEGVFQSTDGGLNWVKIHSESKTAYDVEFKPGDTNTIYASGNKFFKSEDGGETFVKIQGGDALDLWSQDYESGSTDWILAGSNQNNSVTARSGSRLALFYQPDFTRPKTKLISPPLNIIGSTAPILKFSFTNVSFAGNTEELKVFYKTGLNEPWFLLGTTAVEVNNWVEISINLPDPSGDYYIAFEGTSNYARGLTLDDISVEDPTLGVVFSDDFESLPEFNGFNYGAKMIGVSADNPEVVYILEEKNRQFGGLYKSIDGGDQFSKLEHANKNYFGYSSSADDVNGQAPRDMDIIVNPSDVNDVHIAGILSWRSTNGGVDFTVTSQWIPQTAASQDIGYCHADIDIMIYHNDKIYVGSDGGIFVANDPLNVSRTYYTDLSAGLGIRQFYKIGISQTDPVIVSGGSQDNGTSVYRADGVWYDWLGADGTESFVDHSNSNILYGSSQRGRLYKSFNQGATRIDINFGDFNRDGSTDGNFVTPFEQDPSEAATLYSGYSQIYKSTDRGTTWNSISQDFGNNATQLKIAPSDSNTMYAAFRSSIYKTTNGGAVGNWSRLIGFSGYITSIAIHPTNPNKIAIATTSSAKVYISSDGGATWTSVVYDLPNFSALALVWDTTYDEDILYLGMNYGIYYLREDGTSWTSYNTGLPNIQINELEINTADKKLYVATFGRGLWRVNLYNPASLGVDDLEVSELILSPNPTTGIFKLNWKLNTQVTLKIYDPLGKLVFYEKNRNLSQNPLIELQAPKGVYFLKVNSLNKEVTKKLIIN